jgi:hypothetical protein
LLPKQAINKYITTQKDSQKSRLLCTTEALSALSKETLNVTGYVQAMASPLKKNQNPNPKPNPHTKSHSLATAMNPKPFQTQNTKRRNERLGTLLTKH